MKAWSLTQQDLKRYPHFDSPISAADGVALATDPDRVARHAFYPFLLFSKGWTKFAEKGIKGARKERPIRYAARRDAYIFSRYRHALSEKYEAELKKLGLADSVLAYRRIFDPATGGGKCNIHFARDAVSKVRELGDCVVLTLDISSFFESLDHRILKNLWCRLLGKPRLPADHFRVFESITNYSVVDKRSVYERLGLFGVKSQTKWGTPIKGYLVPYRQVPIRLCTGAQFREKIVNGGAGKSIIKKNRKSFGIPQGAPISDLLANLYLLDFDAEVSSWARELGGAYYRYSDDILVAVPGDEAAGRALMTRIAAEIKKYGKHLEIKSAKSSLYVFSRVNSDQECQLIHGKQGRNGLEYLGFRYDGKRVFIRDATLSNLRRKVVRVARREAGIAARRYPTKDLTYLRSVFDYERLISRFGRIRDFGENQDDCRKWTFWTYAIKAAKILGPIGASIPYQLRRHRQLIRGQADKELARAIVRRDEK